MVRRLRRMPVFGDFRGSLRDSSTTASGTALRSSQRPVASPLIARMAVAVAGLIAGWRQSAAPLRFGNAKRASFMGPSAQHSVSTTNRRRWTG
jgi:hypothetical protein